MIRKKAVSKYKIFVTLLLSVICLFSTQTYAVDYVALPDPNNISLSNPLDILFSGSSLAAPGWFKNGTRLYFSASAAEFKDNISYDSLDLYPIVKKQLLRNSNNFVVQNDIISVTENIVWINTQIYSESNILISDALNRSIPSYGQFWVNSKSLASLQKNNKGGFIVTSIKYAVDKNKSDAKRIDYRDEKGNHYTWIFEVDTGLLLYSSIRTFDSNNKPYILISEYLSKRQLSIATNYSGLSKIFSVGSTISYQGTEKTVTKTSSKVSPVVINALVEEMGLGWAEFQIGRALSNIKTNKTYIFVIAQGLIAGSLWLPPEYLSKLKAGIIIDSQDPFTKAEVEVTFVGSQFNTQVVTITKTSAYSKSRWSYRLSDGLLIYWYEENLVDLINNTTSIMEVKHESIK